MITIAFQIAENASFIALFVLIWRLSKRPGWRVRTVIYGWAAVFVWAVLWAFLLPLLFYWLVDSKLQADAFPEGPIVVAALFTGWIWPLVIVVIRSFGGRKKTGMDHGT